MKGKTKIKSQVTAQERIEAEAALRSLKQKMANAPKKPVKQSSQRTWGSVGLFNQNNKKVYNNINKNYNMAII